MTAAVIAVRVDSTVVLARARAAENAVRVTAADLRVRADSTADPGRLLRLRKEATTDVNA